MKKNSAKISYHGLAIGYIRVSTEEQGHSRNGLEAQKSDITSFCEKNDLTLAEEKPFYEEWASGGLDVEKRPTLKEALDFVRKHKGSVLIVSKIDRLARDSHVSTGIMRDKNITFYSVEHGINADPFILRLFANLAEKEREMISARTKTALNQLKIKYEEEGLGRKLGTPIITEKHSSRIYKKKSEDFAFDIYTNFIIPNKLQHEPYTVIMKKLRESEWKPVKADTWALSSVHTLVLKGEEVYRERNKPKRGRPRKNPKPISSSS